MTQVPDPNAFTTPFSITESIHRDPYWAIDPKNPANNQAGKIIIITGASAGLGAVSILPSLNHLGAILSHLTPN